VTTFTTRIDGRARPLPTAALCDGWLADGLRFGDEVVGLEPDRVIGHWPGELETDAVIRLAQAVGDAPSWDAHTQTPPVAQKLAERARPMPLDLEIMRHLQHLQHVCHRPRLHLRVEEERLPVSRARRTPVRAVADLVSHPGDWEHRTLRSIQPSRVLARKIEDEWNLYENRVAVRLVDHLLAYLARRLEELRKIKEVLDASRDYSDEIRRTSFRRAHRIAELWSNTLESKTQDELGRTMKRLELAQRDLQTLLGAPLYQRVPRRQAVALSLKPTNILVNDPHYRKVAALWRSWVRFGHRRQETAQQRAVGRQREAAAWDRFVLHLVVRGFAALGWSATPSGGGWTLVKAGWSSVRVATDARGVVRVDGDRPLRLLPVCADLAGAAADEVQSLVEQFDGSGGEVVVAHVGGALALTDADRASAWSVGGRAVLFACSPWGIDSEERMARVLHGWLCRYAVPAYPTATTIRALPDWPDRPNWLKSDGEHHVVLRAPTEREASDVRTWTSAMVKDLNAKAQRAKAAKKSFDLAPREAVMVLQEFIEQARERLAGLDNCPVCGGRGIFEPRPGQQPNGSEATWWATCESCSSEWGTRRCTCGSRYRALEPQSGLSLSELSEIAEATAPRDWPDKVFGRDAWAQPCMTKGNFQFRCPDCGTCSNRGCRRCRPIHSPGTNPAPDGIMEAELGSSSRRPR
jgi:hypothetical protein